MSVRIGDIAKQLRDWERYFHNFIGYIFHFEEGRRMRGKFIRETLWRTFSYMMISTPLFILMWYFNMFPNSAGALIVLFILTFDLTLGIALIRTVATYRARVELVYRLSATPLEGDEEFPMSMRDKLDMLEELPEESPSDDPNYAALNLPDPDAPIPEQATDQLEEE